MTKALAAENVRKMHLDDRQFGGKQRVKHRHRSMRQPPRIDNDAVSGFARLLDPVYELPFVIGLPKLDLQIEGCGAGQAPLLDVRQSVMAIDRWISHPKEVEVRAVQNIDDRQWCPPDRSAGCSTAPNR